MKIMARLLLTRKSTTSAKNPGNKSTHLMQAHAICWIANLWFGWISIQATLSDLGMQTFNGFLANVKLSTFDNSSYCGYNHIIGVHIIHLFLIFSFSFLIIFLLLISHLTIIIIPTFSPIFIFLSPLYSIH